MTLGTTRRPGASRRGSGWRSSRKTTVGTSNARVFWRTRAGSGSGLRRAQKKIARKGGRSRIDGAGGMGRGRARERRGRTGRFGGSPHAPKPRGFHRPATPVLRPPPPPRPGDRSREGGRGSSRRGERLRLRETSRPRGEPPRGGELPRAGERLRSSRGAGERDRGGLSSPIAIGCDPAPRNARSSDDGAAACSSANS